MYPNALKIKNFYLAEVEVINPTLGRELLADFIAFFLVTGRIQKTGLVCQVNSICWNFPHFLPRRLFLLALSHNLPTSLYYLNRTKFFLGKVQVQLSIEK